MNEKELGDAAFSAMDRMLEDAEFRNGVIIIYRGEEMFCCHNVYTLRTRLSEAVSAYMQWKFKQLPKDLEDLVNNIIEEYDEEIRDSFAKDMRPKVFKVNQPQPRTAKTRQRAPRRPFAPRTVYQQQAPQPAQPPAPRYAKPPMPLEFPPHMEEQRRQYQQQKQKQQEQGQYPKERPSRQRNAS